MANALYRKLPSGDWMNQASPGSPNYFQVQNDPSDNLWYAHFTYDGGERWFRFTPVGGGDATAVAAQTHLDTYMASVNAGTA